MINSDFEKPTYIHTGYNSREEMRANIKKDVSAFDKMCKNFKAHLEGKNVKKRS